MTQKRFHMLNDTKKVSRADLIKKGWRAVLKISFHHGLTNKNKKE